MSPYFQNLRVRLYHGDCREILPQLTDAVDVAIVDPPYGQTSLEWDRWVDAWPSLIRCDSLWCFGSLRMFTDHWSEFVGWKMSQDLIWEKHNGSGFHADRFKRVHEQAVHFYRGKWSEIYHKTPTTPDATKRTVRRKERPQHMGEISGSTFTAHDGGPRLMRSVIQARSMHGRAVHPTEKPVKIIAPLVEYACPPSGIVLDCFAGSGSTLKAAYDLGRWAIGIEVNEEFCESAARKFEQAALQFDTP